MARKLRHREIVCSCAWSSYVWSIFQAKELQVYMSPHAYVHISIYLSHIAKEITVLEFEGTSKVIWSTLKVGLPLN